MVKCHFKHIFFQIIFILNYKVDTKCGWTDDFYECKVYEANICNGVPVPLGNRVKKIRTMFVSSQKIHVTEDNSYIQIVNISLQLFFMKILASKENKM
jgi:hypothetical protein